ncbi:MAG: carbohydrate binding family 9 domain-containing protein [Bacteroidetes bacterium]|nr:carbohydrate binding family 9 domain-containing protein [Bacteroidota bacterium]
MSSLADMRALVTIGLFILLHPVFGEDRKSIYSDRTAEKISIDGVLSEQCWQQAEIATDFIQNSPVAGAPSTRRTEVRMVYDDQAIYIGATLFDSKDSMTRTLSQRDDVGNADWFGVVFDSYNAGTIGFSFIVTSAGVQVDELHKVDGIDGNWNAVWQSSISVHDDRWIAELKIPFSALRFPKESEQLWGINFSRNIRRNREESYWNFYDPQGINLISQLGQLHGIKEVDSPVRLSFYPYISGYIQNNGETGNTSYTANGGMDVKYGLNESFTLDMTLIPDFGQVQFDNQVLNLSPFEVRYNERRQFFTEGTELFNKGDLFYSRRIGGEPMYLYDVYSDLDSTEEVTSNPSANRLLNATKLSGRTNRGLGIGFFNAVTGNTYATVRDSVTGETRRYLTNPMTNYNVLVFDQNLKNNSSITLVNTSVLRNGHTYDANVTSGAFKLFTKEQKYQAYGQFNQSQLYFKDSADLGHFAIFGIEKSTGQFLWNLQYDESSRNYNPNDLGYFFLTNQRNLNGYLGYNIYEPFWKLYRFWSSLSVNYSRNRIPEAFANFVIVAECGGTFKNFMTAGMWSQIEPVITYDYFEPRVAGRAYEYPRNIRIGGFISSNYSKPFSLDVDAAFFRFDDIGRYLYNMTVSPRFRFSDKFFMVFTNYINYAQNEEGAAVTNNFDIPFDGEDPVFAIRDRFTTENTIEASYIFNNKMGITFRLRHYWSKADYDAFYRLDADGKFQPTTYTGMTADSVSLHNNSFNAFTIDMAYRWVFAPGSELSLVWKNSIFSFSEETQKNYFQNIQDLSTIPATNSISLKLLYYIDYWTLRQKFSRKP